MPLPSSYRDPAGFVVREGRIYKRVITRRGLDDYRHLMTSGLFEDLQRRGLLLGHDEEPVPDAEADWARVLVPEQIPFISYPYEWSFDQLKDAALLTLEAQRTALGHGMSLKDASAYNVQFRGAKPVLIDTLSFQRCGGGAWVAYEQFCRHFLGPLMLMSWRLPDAARYLKADIDGFPLDSVSRLLPPRSYGKPGSLLHIHLHARAIHRKAPASVGPTAGRAPANTGDLVESLRRTIEGTRAPKYGERWTEYYPEARFYPQGAQETKREAVGLVLRRTRPTLVYDLGANTGSYSREAAEAGCLCVAFDGDSGCVNRLYLDERSRGGSRILPLVMDLANPSPALGFESQGTMSLFERPAADLLLCLALLHHLRVSANLPFEKIASFLARLGRWALVEFVPFEDPAVRTLTSRMADFENYTLSAYLAAFTRRFRLHASLPAQGTGRVLHLFERLEP